MNQRPTLDATRLHASIKDSVLGRGKDIISEVEQALSTHDVVVVGMAQNPHPKRAKKALAAKNVAYHYLEYGSYLSEWRPRLALKMWSGWPTFPMVFVKGTLVGGADDVIALLDSGELEKMLG